MRSYGFAWPGGIDRMGIRTSSFVIEYDSYQSIPCTLQPWFYSTMSIYTMYLTTMVLFHRVKPYHLITMVLFHYVKPYHLTTMVLFHYVNLYHVPYNHGFISTMSIYHVNLYHAPYSHGFIPPCRFIPCTLQSWFYSTMSIYTMHLATMVLFHQIHINL